MNKGRSENWQCSFASYFKNSIFAATKIDIYSLLKASQISKKHNIMPRATYARVMICKLSWKSVITQQWYWSSLSTHYLIIVWYNLILVWYNVKRVCRFLPNPIATSRMWHKKASLDIQQGANSLFSCNGTLVLAC